MDKGGEKDNFEVSDLFQLTKRKWIGTGFSLRGDEEGVVVDISVGNFAKWCSLDVMWIIKAIRTDKMTKEFM